MKCSRMFALGCAAAIVIAGCGSDDDDAEPAATSATDGDMATDGDVCPSELVIQTDWFPEVEHGGTYQLIGPNGVADKDTVSYSGPVQDAYAVGGLETVTIRTLNYERTNTAVLVDGDADMAYIAMMDMVRDSAAAPLVSVAKTLDLDPHMVMWDPTQHDIQEPSDLAETGVKFRHFPGSAYVDFLVAEGFLTADQPDPSYDGSDGAWVAASGSFLQQGYRTQEVYKYENDVAWKDGEPADVSFYTVSELGFENYPSTIAMLRSRAEELDECLKLLVPAMQQAWIDFLDDPKPVSDRLIEINEEHDGYWSLSEGLNARGHEIIETEGYGANSPDGTYCSFDLERVQALYNILKPIYDERGTEIADSIDEFVTNKYCENAPGR